MRHLILISDPLCAETSKAATLWLRLASAAARQWQGAQRRRLRRATARTLHGLSDRSLHDIGIDRTEIDSLVATLDGSGRSDLYDRDSRRWRQ